MASLWNDELNEALKTLIAEGYSYAIIGAELSAKFSVKISRNSCIGKARRLGLLTPSLRKVEPRREKPMAQSRERRPVFKVVRMNGNSDRMKIIETSEFVEARHLRCVEVVPLNLTLMELPDSGCHYIAGDDHLYCGRQVQAGSAYCPNHHAIIWVKPLPPKHKAFIRVAA